jgi:hypothetical protein
MQTDESKIDQKLRQALDKLADTDEIEVLLYPEQMGGALERDLLTKKDEGLLDYNVLQLANCIVIRSQKQVILEMANRDDVTRITINPSFTVN